MTADTIDSNRARPSPRQSRPTPGQAANRDGIGSETVLVIGLGNPLIADDSVGLRVVHSLKTDLAAYDNVDVAEDYWGGLRLMERMIGYDAAIVVDAICTGAAPGTIHHLTVDMVATQKSASAHDVDLPTALAFGRRAGAHLPADHNIRLVGVEAEDVTNFSDRCTPAVAAATRPAAAQVLRLLDTMLGEQPK
ncbi:MAG: hydrogenase maturation protease [Planctomycetota bacterium]